MLRFFGAFALVAAISTPCIADTAIIGVGSFTCAKLGETYKQNFKAAENYTTMYVQGYLSGLNDAQAVAGNGSSAMKDLYPSVETIMSAIRARCDARPFAPLFVVIHDYWKSLPQIKE